MGSLVEKEKNRKRSPLKRKMLEKKDKVKF